MTEEQGAFSLARPDFSLEKHLAYHPSSSKLDIQRVGGNQSVGNFLNQLLLAHSKCPQ